MATAESSKLTSEAFLNKTKSLDVSAIDTIRFVPSVGNGFRTKLPSIMRIALFVQMKYGKTEFSPDELRAEYDYFVKNYGTTLSPRDFDTLTREMNRWVASGGTFEIVRKDWESPDVSSPGLEKIFPFVVSAYLASFVVGVAIAGFLVFQDLNLLWLLFYVPIGLGILFVLFCVFFLFEAALFSKFFWTRFRSLSPEGRTLHWLLVFFRSSYYVPWGIFAMIWLLGGKDGVIGHNSADFVLPIFLSLLFAASFVADLLLLYSRWGLVPSIAFILASPFVFIAVLTSAQPLKVAETFTGRKYAVDWAYGKFPSINTASITWRYQTETETYGEPVPTGKIDGFSIGRQGGSETEIEFYRSYGLQLAISSGDRVVYRGVPNDRGVNLLNEAVDSGVTLKIDIESSKTGKTLRSASGESASHIAEIPNANVDQMVLEALSSTQIGAFSVPPYPDVRKNASTIAGIDADGNGVRDDVDRQIAHAVRWSRQTSISFAKHVQALISEKLADDAAQEMAKMIFCDAKGGIKADISFIKTATLNTDARLDRYESLFVKEIDPLLKSLSDFDSRYWTKSCAFY